MRQVRVHGRGGQGVVTAAEMLARTGFMAGHEAQAIPSFGSERTGAPVIAYCRFDDRPLRTREPVLHPDVVLVQDPTLLASERVFDGVPDGGVVIVNTEGDADDVRTQAGVDRPGVDVITVPAMRITMEHLGTPRPSAAMSGAYAAVSDDITLEAIQAVYRTRFPGRVGEANARAAAAARAHVAAQLAGEDPEQAAAAAVDAMEVSHA